MISRSTYESIHSASPEISSSHRMMKMTTLKDVKNSLEKMQYVVKVDPAVRLRAKAAVDAMLEYTGAVSKKA